MDKSHRFLEGLADQNINSFGDMIIDYVRIYKPAPLTEPDGRILGKHRVKRLGGNATFEAAYVNQIQYAYENTSFRSSDQWKADYVGYDLYEHINDPTVTTPYYKVTGNMIPMKGVEEAFVFINADDGNKPYLSTPKTLVNGQPYDGYTHRIEPIDQTSLTETELAGHLVTSGGNHLLLVYTRRGNMLYQSLKEPNLTWVTTPMANAQDVADGTFECAVRDGFEIILYRNTSNQLVELRRKACYTTPFGKTIFSSHNVTEYLTFQPLSLPVTGEFLIDPVNPEEYYYVSTIVPKKILAPGGSGTPFGSWPHNHIVKIYKSYLGIWEYRSADITHKIGNGWSPMLRKTVEGDASWRKLYYTDDGNTLMQFEVDHLTPNFGSIAPVTYGPEDTYVRNVVDFIAGNSHKPGRVNADPKNIYFMDGNSKNLWMLQWQRNGNYYERSKVEFLQNTAATPLRLNSWEGGKDAPSFWLPHDGVVRKLRYQSIALPLDNQPCNPFTPSPTNRYIPISFLQGNGTVEQAPANTEATEKAKK